MKYHLLFVLTGIASLFLSIPKAGLAKSDKLLASIEFSLQAYQQQRLNMDMPAASISLDRQRGLWIAGKRSVWKWNFENNKLFEINLIKNEQPKPLETLRHIAEWNDDLIVTSHEKLYKISFDPLKVLEFQATDQAHPRRLSFGIHVQKNRIFWTKSSGVWSMNLKEQILSKLHAHPPLHDKDQILLDPQLRQLWIIRKNKLLAYDYQQAAQKPQTILEIKYPFTGIMRPDSEIIAHTRHTVLILNSKGNIKKTIPVEGKRKLVLADIHAGQHNYLFHDRFLEIHRTDSMDSLYSKVKLGRVRKAGQMVARKNMLGLILDGKPRVFQIEGRW